MKICFATLSDAANASQDGKTNILGIFQRLYAQSVPATHGTMVLTIVFRVTEMRDLHPQEIHIVINDPDGDELFNNSLPYEPEATIKRGMVHNYFLIFSNFLLPKFGDYTIHIQAGNEFTSVPLSVVPFVP